ncbi:hypothetical protein, partial [Brevundimonas denitrificans]|uniref:hypothetical protein n=1 Tax=Brevundimonas denitrificans TaxID=1443434 RepID=UPI00223B4305
MLQSHDNPAFSGANAAAHKGSAPPDPVFHPAAPGRLTLAGWSIRYLPDSPPVFDTSKARARWAAAKADYLAGGGAPEVCERHGLSLRTFRWRASKEGWRRADQPAP